MMIELVVYPLLIFVLCVNVLRIALKPIKPFHGVLARATLYLMPIYSAFRYFERADMQHYTWAQLLGLLAAILYVEHHQKKVS